MIAQIILGITLWVLIGHASFKFATRGFDNSEELNRRLHRMFILVWPLVWIVAFCMLIFGKG